MAGSVNKAILLGFLGKDPEIRSFADGKRVASFSLATSENWKGKNGEHKEKTAWHNIVVFNDTLVTVIDKYVRKGSKVYIEGSLQTRKWIDQNGVEKYTTEIVLQNFNGTIVLLDDRKASEGSETPENDETGTVTKNTYKGRPEPLERDYGASKSDTEDFLNDSIPF